MRQCKLIAAGMLMLCALAGCTAKEEVQTEDSHIDSVSDNGTDVLPTWDEKTGSKRDHILGLTQDERPEDYDYLVKTLKDSYLCMGVRDRENPEDLSTDIFREYREMIEGSDSDDTFYTAVKSINSVKNKNTKITAGQADEMALALTNKIWVWEWVEFFVPYMSKEGAEKLVSASKHSEWAGSIDYTSGKKLKFTKKQVNAARKHTPSEPLTCKDLDGHALMIMQSNGDWECISFMLPYMSKKGIRAVTRCYNSKHKNDKKRAADYY